MMSRRPPRQTGSQVEGHEGARASLPSFQFTVIENDTGRKFQFEPEQIDPLSLDVLLNVGPEGADLPLVCLTNSATLDGVALPGHCTIRWEINFHRPPVLFGLVEGGWLPASLVLPRNHFVDRNVVATLLKLREGAQRSDIRDRGWWLSLMQGEGVTFNPLPYAMEGARRATPTEAEFSSGMKEAADEISKSFPQARIVKSSPEHLRAAYALVKSLADRSGREASFLNDAVPLVIEPVSASRLRRVNDELHALATRHGVEHKSLAYLVVLSCLYDDEQHAIGRSVLRPRVNYGLEQAYNALSDLRHIEMLVASKGVTASSPFCLCTSDRGLAALWCALGPRFAGPRPTAGILWKVTVDQRMFPRLDAKGWDDLRNVLADGT